MEIRAAISRVQMRLGDYFAGYILYFKTALILGPVIVVAAVVTNAILGVFGEARIDPLHAATRAMALVVPLVAVGCGSVITAVATDLLLSPRDSVRPWMVGFGASGGLWGTMLLLGGRGISLSDFAALFVAFIAFGLLFGYGIHRWRANRTH